MGDFRAIHVNMFSNTQHLNPPLFIVYLDSFAVQGGAEMSHGF